MKNYRLTGFLVALMLAGCTSVPKMEQNKTLELNLPLGEKTAQLPLGVMSQEWWKTFNDTQLNKLIEKVLTGNQDYKIALLNYDKSQEIVTLAQANQSPQLNMEGSLQRQRLSEEAFYPPPLAGSYINFAQLSLKGSYTFDFLGKVDSLVKEQQYRSEAIALNQKNMELLLSIQTVKLYGYWQYLNEQVSLIDEELAASKKIVQLTQFSIKNGLGIESDLLNSQNTVKSLEVTKTELEVNQKTTLNSIARLMGSTESVSLISSSILQQAKYLRPVASIKSDAVENRPDVAYYLFNIAAQKEKLNALRADFYPSISLTGEIGLQKIGIAQFLNAGNMFSSFGPAIHLPIFDAGRIQSNYKVGGIDLNIFIEQYNQAVIKSFYDINDSLLKVKRGFEIMDLQEQTFMNEEKKFSLAQVKNRLGKSSNYELVQNEINYLNQKRQHSNTQLTYFNSNVELINALGGVATK